MDRQIQIASPAPILNTPDFAFAFGGNDGNSIPLNEKGQPHFFEFVALKGTVFEVIEKCSKFIVRVSTPKYPGKNLFLDLRFCQSVQSQISPLLSRDKILDRMKKLLGTSYVWGGNWSRGVPDLLLLYPPKGKIELKIKKLWTFNGVDCSGLLYEAAKGTTPRNTSQLIHFGKGLKIGKMSFCKILTLLEPLDMIIYHRHVLFVLTDETTIESRYPFGVIQRNLRDRLLEIYQEKKAVDEWDFSLDQESQFLIRRFIHL